MSREEIVLDLVARIVTNKSNFLDVEFGSEDNILYIDGCTTYKSEEEKEAFMSWLEEMNRKG